MTPSRLSLAFRTRSSASCTARWAASHSGGTACRYSSSRSSDIADHRCRSGPEVEVARLQVATEEVAIDPIQPARGTGLPGGANREAPAVDSMDAVTRLPEIHTLIGSSLGRKPQRQG